MPHGAGDKLSHPQEMKKCDGRLPNISTIAAPLASFLRAFSLPIISSSKDLNVILKGWNGCFKESI